MAAAERRERCVEAVDSLRDQVLGRVSVKAAPKEPSLKLPLLAPLKAAASLPFFSADYTQATSAVAQKLLLRLNGCCSETHEECHGSVQTHGDPASPARALLPSTAELFHSAAADYLRPSPPVDPALQPLLLRGAVQHKLQGSSSWSRLPAAQPVAPKRPSKVAPERSASQPLLSKKAPPKPAVPVRDLLPFEAHRSLGPRPEAWAPLIGERARRAELVMQQRLRA